MNAKIVFRPATIRDLDTLRRWDEMPHVVESDPNDDWDWETGLGRDMNVLVLRKP